MTFGVFCLGGLNNFTKGHAPKHSRHAELTTHPTPKPNDIEPRPAPHTPQESRTGTNARGVNGLDRDPAAGPPGSSGRAAGAVEWVAVDLQF